jgi:hypothetical protein
MRRSVRCAALLALSAVPALLSAQSAEAPLVPNRPGTVDVPVAVAAGVMHLESGASLFESRSGGAASQIVGAPSLIRIGVGNGWEFRFYEGFTRVAAQGDAISGITDPTVGTMHQFLSGDNGLAAAAIFETTIPSGIAGFSGRGMQPVARVTESWTLPGGRSINVVEGVQWLETPDGHATMGLFGVALGQPITERLSTFVEVASPRVAMSGPGTVMFARTGLAFLVSPNLQVDFDIARGLMSAERGTMLNFGFAVRR